MTHLSPKKASIPQNTTSKTEVTETIDIPELPQTLNQGELPLEQYILEAPPSKTTEQGLQERCYKQQRAKDDTRANLAMWLVKFFGGTVAATFLLVAVAAFVPSADKDFIKENSSTLLQSQTTLLAMAMAYYFGAKSKSGEDE